MSSLRQLAIISIVAMMVAPGSLAIYVGSPSDDQTVVQAAKQLYGVTHLTVYPAEDSAFDPAFPDWDLYLVLIPSQSPAENRAMVYDPSTGKALDATEGFNDVLATNTTLIVSSAEALGYAKTFAQIGNVDFDLSRRVVSSANSSELGIEIHDPVVEQTLTGWKANLWTWSWQNGLLLSWNLPSVQAHLSEPNGTCLRWGWVTSIQAVKHQM